MTEEWPLVGRDDLIRWGVDVVARGGSVLLAGEAGVGKTAVAARIADVFDDDGEVTRIAATTLVGLPMHAFGALPLDAEHGDTSAADVAVVVVDDVHLLDDDAAAVLHRLAVEARIRLIATLRTGTSSSDSIISLWKDGLVEAHDLVSLDRDDVDELLDRVLDGPVDAAVRLQLWEMTLGSPLMLRELVRSTRRAGDLVKQDGLWRFRRAPQSSRLDDLIGRRLEALDPRVRNVVDLVALGEPLGFALLRQVAADEAIEAAERAGLIEIVMDDVRRDVRMSHPMYGDVAARLMGEARAARLCGRLLELLESTPMRRGDDIVRATTWQLRSGGAVVSDDMVLAARRALYDDNERLAIDIATRALKGDPNRTDVALLLASALAVVGELARADEALAAESASRTEAERALVAMQRAVALFWGVGDGPAAEQVLDRTLEHLSPGPWYDEVRAERALIASNQGRLRVATAIVDPLVTGDVPDRVFVTASISASCAWALDGRCLDAIDLAARALGVCTQLGRQPALTEPGIFIVTQVTALTEAGRLVEAEAICRVARDALVAEGKVEGQAWFSMLLGRILLTTGHFEESVALFDESAAAFAAFHAFGKRRWSLAGAAMAASMRGDTETAHRFADELAGADAHPAELMVIEMDRSRAYLLALDGDITGACRELHSIIERHIDNGALALIDALIHDIVRLGGTVDAELWELTEGCQGELTAVRHEFGGAVAARSAPRLAACGVRFAELGAHVFAAEAAAAAAARFVADGDQREAARQRQLVERSRREFDAGPVLTLDLIDAEAASPLTAREAEIARLAAAGRTNREIAGVLFVSVRTVENHLQRVYTKLGVAGRRDLPSTI